MIYAWRKLSGETACAARPRQLLDAGIVLCPILGTGVWGFARGLHVLVLGP
jgi:hypothetical protein